LEFNVSENVFILWMWLGSASTADRDAVFSLKEVNQLLNAVFRGRLLRGCPNTQNPKSYLTFFRNHPTFLDAFLPLIKL
jgi:hypothetical protein